MIPLQISSTELWKCTSIIYLTLYLILLDMSVNQFSKIHSITFIKYTHPWPFAEILFHLLIASLLSAKNLRRVPSGELNSGPHYSKTKHYKLSYARSYWSTPHPNWATPHPDWATPHPNWQTPHPIWATLHPPELRCTMTELRRTLTELCRTTITT